MARDHVERGPADLGGPGGPSGGLKSSRGVGLRFDQEKRGTFDRTPGWHSLSSCGCREPGEALPPFQQLTGLNSASPASLSFQLLQYLSVIPACSDRKNWPPLEAGG